MVVTGDLSQIDLPTGAVCGLRHAARVLQEVEGVGIVNLGVGDVVRHELVSRIVSAYDGSDGGR